MLELPRKACWEASAADAILKTEALAGRDALFLATHTPVRGFNRSGMRATDIVDSTERALLAALSDPARRHVFCIVQGEPGSGKSHLIRWLEVNWPHKRTKEEPENTDVVLLLQRADGSLDGALTQLKKELPEEFSGLFEGLGQRQSISADGRAADFHNGLANRMQRRYYDGKAPEDAEWCEQVDLGILLYNSHVRTRWSGPRRLLDIMSGKAGDRNSESASFDLRDVRDLARQCIRVEDSVASQKLANRLRQEAETIDLLSRDGAAWADMGDQAPADLKVSLKVCAALNRRRNDAVQSVIGISASDLQKLFEGVRAGLKSTGARLVLLLEDITSWEGLDDRLIEALITNAETRDDLCPILSVVGVTPKYYRDLQGNLRQRATHELRLGDDDGGLQDVASMRDSEDRRAFVARYLNAARAGLESLDAWRDRYQRDRDEPLPNRCDRCDLTAGCHRAFGAVDGMGLYPFTANAIDALFFALKLDDDGQTHRTPRGLLQHVLAPTLLYPGPLEQQQYPSQEIEVLALEPESFVLPGALKSLVANQVSEPTTADRLRRTLAIWGDKTRPVTSLQGGDYYFADVNKGVIEAFGLPWLGDETTQAGLRAPERLPSPTDSVAPVSAEAPAPTLAPTVADFEPAQIIPSSSPAPAAPPEQGGVTPTPAAGRARTATITAKARTVTDAGLARLRDQIAKVRTGSPIAEPSLWNETVGGLVKSLRPKRLGIDRWTFTRLFTPELIKVEGTGADRGGRHFFVPKDDVLFDGLEAYAELKLSDDADDATLDYYRRCLARLIRALEGRVRAHANARLPKTASGERWSVAAGLGQILALRAWLRNAAQPTTPLHDQFRDLLNEERVGAADAKARHADWQACLTATDPWHRQFREHLLAMLDTPQAGTESSDFLDAAPIAVALTAALIQRQQFSKLAVRPAKFSIATIDDILDVFEKLSARAPTAAREELKLLKSRAEDLDDKRHGDGLAHRAREIDDAVNEVTRIVPNVPASVLRDWKQAFADLAPFFADAAAVGEVEELMGVLSDPAEIPAGAALVTWLAAAPAARLRDMRELLSPRGDAVLAGLLTVAREHIGKAEGGVDLSGLQLAGQRLEAAALEAQALLLEKS